VRPYGAILFRWTVAAALVVPGLVACTGAQSMLDPAGQSAREVAALWWAMLVVAAVVLAGVVAAWGLALRRRSSPVADEAHDERVAARWIVGGGVLLPSACIAALLAFGIPAGQRMLPSAGPPALRIDVVARQWEWQVRYPPHGVVLTNLLRLPVGRPVDIFVSSDDVIHSFWVPRLGGKIDAIPGRRNVVRLQADAAGPLRGQCAEFCGSGHAGMVLQVEALDEAAFAAWLAAAGR
jgi:cytochrome c oxidase subunit II